jgi:RNA-directed DNA polymerase
MPSADRRVAGCVARRIVDRDMLHLIKMWLKVPAEEREEQGKRHMTGGKGSTRGTPDHRRRKQPTLSQDKDAHASTLRAKGGVISPLLANIYMNRFLKYWRIT